MCGIVGYQTTQETGSLDLAESLSALSHRGPDDSGAAYDSNCGVGLGHTRLAILDLSESGRQPMTSQDGSTTIIFNGEIYNFIELRKRLLSLGYNFKGASDTEVLLNCYLESRKTGQPISDMLRTLNGIFALAIWDRETNILLLARDALGVKPCYYKVSRNGVTFASEIKAMPQLNVDSPTGATHDDVDHVALERYLTYLWCPGEQTPVLSVKKVSPGSVVIIKNGRITRKLRWYKAPGHKKSGDTRRSFNDKPGPYISQLQGILRDAVRKQLVSDVPVGAFLSGGLDSSSIVALAQTELTRLPCFTIRANFPEQEGFADDLQYAQLVARHLNVPLDIVTIEATEMADALPGMVAQLDEPLADPAPLNVLYISQLARDNGIKVLLSGAGGDDLFTGYRRHQALVAEKYWAWLPSCIRVALEQATIKLPERNPSLRRLKKLFVGASLSPDDRMYNYFRWNRRADLYELFTDDFKSKLSDDSAEEVFREYLSDIPQDTDRLEKMLALEQKFFLADHNLTYTDKMSMATGVEVRVPFLDPDLVQFAASVPASLKMRRFETKWLLKKAMEPHLPRQIIYRPKSGFGAPLRYWLKNDLNDWLRAILSTQNLKNRGFFDASAVQRLIEENFTGQKDAAYTLFALACVELWCQRFIDSPG